MIGPRMLLIRVSVAKGCMTSSYFHTMMSEVTPMAGRQQDTPKGASSPDATQQLGAEEGHRRNGGSCHQIRTSRKLTGFDIATRIYSLASSTMLKGVSAARRTRLKPPSMITFVRRASPACAPSARPTSCASEAGVQTTVDAA